jgi:hypothetical protein
VLDHGGLAARNGALNADGSVAPGYWVGTAAEVDGEIVGFNSQSLYNNMNLDADATEVLRSTYK